jgi:hypothetical protein
MFFSQQQGPIRLALYRDGVKILNIPDTEHLIHNLPNEGFLIKWKGFFHP